VDKKKTALYPFRVLDLTDEKGQFCGQLLGALGADVIKIEMPNGDLSRRRAPFFKNIPTSEKSLFWLGYNANKRGITLNIETSDGKKIFKQMVQKADVVIESFNPGYMRKLGLGYEDLEQINSRIIMASLTPYGQTGPYRDYKASDLDCWAVGGLLSITGDPGTTPARVSHIPISFLCGSIDAAWASVLALFWRESSGEGQYIDVSIQESVAKTIISAHDQWVAVGEKWTRGSSTWKVQGSQVSLRAVWPTKDGFITYLVFGGEAGKYRNPRLVRWLQEEGMADDFLTNIDWGNIDWRLKTQEAADEIQGYFYRFFQSKTSAELLQGALARDIELHPMSAPHEVLDHIQLQARGYWQEVEQKNLGMILKYPSRFFLSNETFCRVWRPAPRIGEHNKEIYKNELGFSSEKLITLKQGGII
jgi:crotonobetainyl-CoA:carnitine CoA-transferase CaiB-like acyl-CoA transferase